MTTEIKTSSLVGWCPVCGMKQRFRNIPVNIWHDVKCGVCKKILQVNVVGRIITYSYNNYDTSILIFKKQIEIQRSYDGINVDFEMDKPKHRIPLLDKIIMELDIQIDEYYKIRKKDEELESFILADLTKSRYDRVLRLNKIREDILKYNEYMENNYIALSTLMDVICTKCLNIMKIPYGKCMLSNSKHKCEYCGNRTTIQHVTKLYTNTCCDFDDGEKDIRISFKYEKYFDQCILYVKIYESVDPFMCSMLNFGKERYSSEYVSEPIKQFSAMEQEEKLKTMDDILHIAYKLWKEGKSNG